MHAAAVKVLVWGIGLVAFGVIYTVFLGDHVMTWVAYELNDALSQWAVRLLSTALHAVLLPLGGALIAGAIVIQSLVNAGLVRPAAQPSDQGGGQV